MSQLPTNFAATRNALTGHDVTFGDEDPAEYEALRANLYTEHTPQTEQEAMLVECIAQSWWKLERLEQVEHQAMAAAKTLSFFSEKSFQGFVRYKASVERTWTRARKELADLKKLRAKTAPATAKVEVPRPAAEIAKTNPIPATVPPPRVTSSHATSQHSRAA